MDSVELDRRTRMHEECVPPDLVDRLLALGHADLVRAQALAEDGDWFCAHAWARLLADRGRLEEALAVLAPYVGTGWWTAASEAARLLDAGGRGEEAIALVRPFARDGERFALRDLALLLARHGQGDEAYELLLPHVADWFLAEPLVEVGIGLGRGEEVAALLEARIASGTSCARCGSRECGERYREPFHAVKLLASVRERQGRTDEAVALLRSYDSTPVDNRDPLAELLVRHGRIDELRAYAADEDWPRAVRHLAEFLEARGDVAGAVEVYREHAERYWWYAPALLAELLARHGRSAEAIEVVRALNSAEDCTVDLLSPAVRRRGPRRGGPRPPGRPQGPAGQGGVGAVPAEGTSPGGLRGAGRGGAGVPRAPGGPEPVRAGRPGPPAGGRRTPGGGRRPPGGGPAGTPTGPRPAAGGAGPGRGGRRAAANTAPRRPVAGARGLQRLSPF